MPFTEFDKEELKSLLKQVITETVEQHPLTDEEIKWVRLAIEAQAQRKEFRDAVISKSIIGLISAAALWAGSKLIEFFLAHWK